MNRRNIRREIVYLKVVEISNDLKNLIPIGTLHFCDLPFNYSDFSGIEVTNHEGQNGNPYRFRSDGWKWLDIDFFMHMCKENVHPILKDIHFLVYYRFIMATFKFVKVQLYPNSSSHVTFCKVRIYAVPSDITGFRFFTEWRSLQPKSLSLDKRFGNIWFKLIEFIDFSEKGWDCSKTCYTLEEFSKRTSLLICSIPAMPVAYFLLGQPETNFHIERWTSNLPSAIFSKSVVNTTEETFGSKIQQLYNNIISPSLAEYENKEKSLGDPKVIPTPEELIITLLKESRNGNNAIPGVTSQLYPFQIKSLCKMLEKESIDKKALIPNFIRIRSPNSKLSYYYDLLSDKFYTTPEFYDLPKGGVLAENMGLGKTLICLSLICLTKCDISQVPQSYLLYKEDDSFKLDTYSSHGTSQMNKSVKKLVDICKDYINQNSLPWKHYIDDIPSSVVNRLTSSPGFFRIPLESASYNSSYRSITRKVLRRLKSEIGDQSPEGQIYRTLFLSNTTLIVVPDNLFHQWNNELKKHVHPYYLNKLFISSQFRKATYSQNSTFTGELPKDAKDLIKYDLILITHSLLAKLFGNLNIQDNPFEMIYWKRLIIDEGHSVHSKKSRISLLCKSLHSERRWAVTGTPTSGLTRLHMDEEKSESLNTNNKQNLKKSQYVIKSTFNEKDDLIKLGAIVGNFLKIEPFYSQPKLWSTTIIRPLAANLYGSTMSFSNLLNAIVVRHALKDIEQNLKLPPLHHEPVFLQPSYHNKLAINLFTAVLAVNAVSSERIDVDYMFHPSNRQQLRKLITNLQRATFHWTGFKQDDIEALIHICNLSLKKRKENGESVYGDYDISLLHKSIRASKMALSNPRWRTLALLHEMNYYVSGLPDIFTKNFGTGVLEATDSNGERDDISVFGAPHLNSMQEFFYKNRFIDMNNEELLKAKLEFSSRSFWTSYWKENLKRNSERFNKQDDSQDFNSSVKAEEIEEAINMPKVVETFYSESTSKSPIFSVSKAHFKDNSYLGPKEELIRQDGEGLKITDQIKTNKSVEQHNISYQSIKAARILGTASAKLSYLASRLLEHQIERVKSIVFFEFEDSAYYLTELLEVLGIKYILYATFINPSQRTNNLAEFSNFLGGVTLIMDLRLASHGLTIISASRVYFINPVWQRSVEAQAIKRAHRIGQTKDVYVETLVLKGSLEEEIYKRRSQDEEPIQYRTKDDKPQKKYVIDDSGMQDFILKHEFLEHDPNEVEFAPIIAPAMNPYESVKVDFDNLNLEYSLLKHKDQIRRSGDSHVLKEWDAYLFSEDNLSMLNNIKNQKIKKKFLQSEFLRKFVDPNEQDMTPETDEVKKRNIRSDGPNRKKVRF